MTEVGLREVFYSYSFSKKKELKSRLKHFASAFPKHSPTRVTRLNVYDFSPCTHGKYVESVSRVLANHRSNWGHWHKHHLTACLLLLQSPSSRALLGTQDTGLCKADRLVLLNEPAHMQRVQIQFVLPADTSPTHLTSNNQIYTESGRLVKTTLRLGISVAKLQIFISNTHKT